MTQFGVLCADPPWSFGDRLQAMKRRVKRSASSQYDTLSTFELCEMGSLVKDVSAKDCLLALWVPATLLRDGFNVIDSWGFTYKTLVTWTKLKKRHKEARSIEDFNDALAFGMGRLFRSTSEVVLIATRGNVYKDMLKNRSQRNVVIDVTKGHSTKTERLQDSLDVMFPDVQKCELFARRLRPGWTCVGKSIDGLDIRDALQQTREVQNGI